MEFSDVLLKRRSIRKYGKGKPTKEQIDAIMKAAMSGPSGCNFQPWRFVVALTDEVVERIIDAAPHGKYGAPCAILVIGDTKASPKMWYQDCGAATENILLEITNQGLGGIWCAVYPFEDRMKPLAEIANLKEGEVVFSLIFCGEAGEEKEARTQYDPSRVSIL